MPGRKILWVLGAGASYGAGAYTTVQHGGRIPIPMQVSFWPTVLRFCTVDWKLKMLEHFLFKYFTAYDRVPSTLNHTERADLVKHIDVEEVFTFVSERIQSPSTAPQTRTYMLTVWRLLVELVGTTFRRFRSNSDTREIFRKLRRSMLARDAVVSFNYDTVFEESLPLGRRCYYWGTKPLSQSGLRILKPHGSVNWSLSETEINVLDVPVHPVIVAPTHLKFISGSQSDENGESPTPGHEGYLTQSPIVSQIWKEMERQMKVARVLVFIGYSFPVSDLYFSSILRSVLTDRRTDMKMVLVNPDAVAIARRLQARFPLHQIEKHFELKNFVDIPRHKL